MSTNKYDDFKAGTYQKYSLSQLVKENEYLKEGEAFLMVSIVPEREAGPLMRIDVVSTPMDADLLRGMLMAAAYHSNINGTDVDAVLVRRGIDE